MKVGAGWGLGCVNTPADLGTMWFDKFNINVWEGLCQSMCVCVCLREGERGRKIYNSVNSGTVFEKKICLIIFYSLYLHLKKFIGAGARW